MIGLCWVNSTYPYFMFEEDEMSEAYSYEQCQPVIKEAFKKAIDHLKETLGDQYSMSATKFAWGKFQHFAEPSRRCNPVLGRNHQVTVVLSHTVNEIVAVDRRHQDTVHLIS